VLKVSDASGGYAGTIIIRRISLEVAAADQVALLGRNGAGKTTLMKYIMGLLAARSGSVALDGRELAPAPAQRARAGLGYVPQGRNVFPRLSVRENIVVAAAACKRDHRKAVEQIFTMFPLLAARPNLLAGSLSGGQQQILAIGRALATAPKVLLLDEPTEGVQPSIVDEMEEVLLRLNREQGLALLIAEQNLDFAASITRRAYIMDKGQIAHSTSREDLLADKHRLHELLGV
jgi:urea ABC transporter ATP-binding protein UrtE